MRLKSSHIFVLVFAGLLVLVFGVGTVFAHRETRSQAEAKTGRDGARKTVEALTVQAPLVPETAHEYSALVRGRTEAARSVVARAETAGVVAQTPAKEGAFVPAGTVLCRLAVDARQATLDQARAALQSRKLQQQASAELVKKGFRSQTQMLQDQAALDAAQAAVRQAEIALAQVNIRAPFAGVFDRRDAEVGTYLAPGQACGSVIELNPLLIVGDLPETLAAQVKLGATAQAKLVSGHVLTGHVRYVAREADPQTRTYRLEIAAANPDFAARSGLSADVRIAQGTGPAHLVPVSALVLDASGRQGVRHVLADNMVAFAPVTVLEETPAGVWVSGLRGPVRVITVGQSYVAEGQKVRVAAAR
jgi:multidrug efflux system membrane fusion protein